MDIAPVSGVSMPVSTPGAIPPQKAAENRSIAQAVKTLNGTEMFGQGNHLTFQRDPESQRMVIQVINTQTHEVVLQIPPEYVLRLAEDLKQQQAESNPCKTG